MNRTLPDLQRDLVRIHRARLMRRRAIATGAVALPALALAFVMLSPSPRRGEGGSPQANREGGETSALAHHNSESSPIRDPQSAIRNSSFVTIVHDAPHIETMTDDELLAALAEAGQPSGLITIDGKTTVVANMPASTRSSITTDPQ